MENDKFKGLSEKQKRQKLKFILKEKTQGYLNDTELSAIIEKIKVNRQYGIKLYFDANAFENALILPQTSSCEVVLGALEIEEKTGKRRLKNQEQPLAVIVRNAYEGGECNLHIYIPNDRRPKGKKRKDMAMVLCQQNCVDDKYICHHVEYSEKYIFCALNPPKEERKNA